MSHVARQSGGGGRRTRTDEPRGALSVGQLNHLRALCATHLAEEEASSPERPVPLPVNDALFSAMERELSSRVSTADYERMRSSLPSTRYSFAKQFQRMLSIDASGKAGIPLDWEDLSARGEEGSARYAATLEEKVRDQPPKLRARDEPARVMLVKSFQQVWGRLCEQTFDATKSFSLDTKAGGTPMLTVELDAIFQTDSSTYLPLVHAALAPYIGSDSESRQEEKLSMVSQLMCNFLHPILNDQAAVRPFPESWQELDARLKDHEPELIDFLDKKGSGVGLNLIGHEKELVQLYRDIGARMKTIGRYCAAPATVGTYLN